MTLTPETQRAIKTAWPRLSRYVPHRPTAKQAAFMSLPHREAGYGGAVGGGKSDALLMGALQYSDVPGYVSFLFRRTYQDLSLPDCLIPRSHEWLAGHDDAHWDGTQHAWRFANGSVLGFGYLSGPQDHLRYQGMAAHFMGFDEATQLLESQYTYLIGSRMRQGKDSRFPIRARIATNPGGPGHEWVRTRFVDSGNETPFVNARLEDNPFLDTAAYDEQLKLLDPVTRQQLRFGDWTVMPDGEMFARAWFGLAEEAPLNSTLCRFWDLAATVDGDWTVGALVGYLAGRWYVLDIVRARTTPHRVEELVKATTLLDPKGTLIGMEQEPGSSGVNTVAAYRRVLAGWPFYPTRPTGSKIERARPLSAAAEAGNVTLIAGSWTQKYIDELCGFPIGAHDDQVDATTGAMETLRQRAAQGRRPFVV